MIVDVIRFEMRDELIAITSLEHVRERPQLYFDVQSQGVANCMAREVYCLAIDQIIAGHCSLLITNLEKDGSLTISHNGKPLGITQDPRRNSRPEMILVAEEMAFCANRAADQYVKTDVCKSGMTAVNGCSERFEIHNFVDGKHYALVYEHGKSEKGIQEFEDSHLSGVKISFMPDRKLLQSTEFDLDELQDWFNSLPLDKSNVKTEWVDFFHKSEG